MRKAVELAPSDTRFSYVLAVALHGNSERDEAIRVLETTLKARPNDANALQALAGTCATPASASVPPKRGACSTRSYESESAKVSSRLPGLNEYRGFDRDRSDTGCGIWRWVALDTADAASFNDPFDTTTTLDLRGLLLQRR